MIDAIKSLGEVYQTSNVMVIGIKIFAPYFFCVKTFTKTTLQLRKDFSFFMSYFIRDEVLQFAKISHYQQYCWFPYMVVVVLVPPPPIWDFSLFFERDTKWQKVGSFFWIYRFSSNWATSYQQRACKFFFGTFVKIIAI